MKIIVVGDSIAEGLGVAGHSYADLLGPYLSREWGCDVTTQNLAHTGTQITDTLKLIRKIVSAQPDVVVVAHGVTEAIVRPSQRAMRYVPPRWRQKGWLDPRPYFSRRPHKRLSQQIESALRWRLKVFLIKMFGGETWLSPQEYHDALRHFVDALRENTPARIVFLTPPNIDDKFFPGSTESLRSYQEQTENVAVALSETRRVSVCYLESLLEQWSDFFVDHFHPNASGHIKIADALVAVLLTPGVPGSATKTHPQTDEKLLPA